MTNSLRPRNAVPATTEARPAALGPLNAAGNLSGLQKMIFICELDNIILAARAAKWLLERPTNKDAVLVYGEGAGTVFYVRRNKAGISVRQDSA